MYFFNRRFLLTVGVENPNSRAYLQTDFLGLGMKGFVMSSTDSSLIYDVPERFPSNNLPISLNSLHQRQMSVLCDVSH